MFDKLKRLFIVEDESSKKVPQQKTATNAPTPSSASEIPMRSQSSPSVTGTPTDKFTNILFGAIEANDLDGFDYLEYKESLQSLSKMNMDEATRYKSAFAMAQTMGATPQKLIDSIVHYRNVLAKEQSKFDQALGNQRTKQIDGEHQKIKQLQQGIAAKKEQLKHIEEQIANDEKALEQSKAGIEGAESRINETKANFIASFEMIVGQLDQDVEKIKTYLK